MIYGHMLYYSMSTLPCLGTDHICRFCRPSKPHENIAAFQAFSALLVSQYADSPVTTACSPIHAAHVIWNEHQDVFHDAGHLAGGLTNAHGLGQTVAG